MANIFVVFAIIGVVITNCNCAKNNECIEQSPCLCKINEYSKIDISKVTPKGDSKQPQFLEDKHNNVTFYFHGCTNADFVPKDHGISNFKDTLHGVLIRYEENPLQNLSTLISLGNASQLRFEGVADQVGSFELLFTSSNGSVVLASVLLICDSYNASLLKIIKSDPPVLALISPEVCVFTQHPGLSKGSVLLILFFITVAIYFFGGMTWQYFGRGARGLEMIPNIDFWRELPGLVKDGVIFLFSGCNVSAVSTAESYDRI